MTFNDPVAAARTGVPLHTPLFPAQIAQATADLALAGILTFLYRRKLRPEGSVFWWYVVIYSLGRGVIEIWRGDTQRGLWFGGALSTSQILSIAAGLFAAGMLVAGFARRRRPLAP